MSFAALRQTVLQAHCLSTDRFAEDAELVDGSDARTVRVKITHEQVGPGDGRRSAAVSETRRGTFDEQERIQVTVSRDPNWEYGVPIRPQPTAELRRKEEVDSDRRPYVFTGQTIFEGDQHACYVFHRQRRVVQGRDA